MVVIDGNNVAYAFKPKGVPQIENIELILDSWSLNDEIIVIVSPYLYRRVNNQDKLNKLIDNGNIIQVPKRFNDDEVILQYAFETDDFIISNDNYREYKSNFPKHWIEDHRIEFVIIHNIIYFALSKHTTKEISTALYEFIKTSSPKALISGMN